jgi:hypothetical protein
MHTNCVTDLLDALVEFSSDVCVDFPENTQKEKKVKLITQLQHYPI